MDARCFKLNKIKKIELEGKQVIKMLLTKERCTLISIEDYEKVRNLKWVTTSKGKYAYAIYQFQDEKTGKWIKLNMSKFILKPKDNECVYYKNGITLDNRRDNLLVIPKSSKYYMNRNTVKSPTGYKGVYLNKKSYVARISIKDKKINLGSFKNKARAAIVFDKAAQHYIGPFANTNFRPSLKKDHIKVKTIDY